MTMRTPSMRALTPLGILAALGLGAALLSRGPARAEPPRADDETKAAIQRLAALVLPRLDEADQAREQALDQEITTKRAEADIQNAQKTVKVAEIAIKEYLEGTVPQELKTIEGEITLARSDRARAADQLKWTAEMVEKKHASPSQKLADEMALKKAQISERQALEKMKVLQNFSKPRKVTELQADVEKARSDLLAKMATLDLEKSKLERLRRRADGALLPEERRMLAALDEAIGLDEEGGDAARVKARLVEAAQLWKQAEEERARRRDAEIRSRIRGEAARLRASG
jgi:hypothetical protein